MKKIIATIGKSTGSLTIKTEGFAGDECLKATEKLEKGLGGMNAQCQLTDEFYQNIETKTESNTQGEA